jgi:hypothetical protein
MDVDSKCLNTPLMRASPACFNKPTDVRFWHKADMSNVDPMSAFGGKDGVIGRRLVDS